MSYGLGIGAFMDGLVKGAQVARSFEKDRRDAAMAERRLKLLEGADAREADQQKWSRGIRERELTHTESSTKFNQGIATRQIDLAEDKDEREAANSAEDRKWLREDRAADAPVKEAQRRNIVGEVEAAEETRKWRREDRAADAPVKEAQRRAAIETTNDGLAARGAAKTGTAEVRGIIDAQRQKSIVRGTDDIGRPTITVDGQVASDEADANRMFEQRHGTFMQKYREIAVPKIQQSLLERGDRVGADAWQKWNDDARVKESIDTVGRIEGAFQSGDWDGVQRHFTDLQKNGNYMILPDSEIKTEPIKEGGKTVGIRSILIDKKKGTKVEQEHRDIASLHRQLMGIINPASVFEHNRKQIEAVETAKIDIAKERSKTASAIEVERVKGDMAKEKAQIDAAGRIAAERAKALNVDPREYYKGVMETWKRLSEDTGFMREDPKTGKKVPMTAEEQAAQAAQVYEQVRRQGEAVQQRTTPPPGAAPGTSPTPRSLFSRP